MKPSVNPDGPKEVKSLDGDRRTPKIGDQIAAILLAKKMKRADLIAQAGISASALAQYISGKNTPKLETICLLADIFSVSLDELICGDNFKSSFNLNPIEEALERRLDALLSRVSERRDLSVRVGMHLAGQIDTAVQAVKLVSSVPGGFLTDDEIMLLEEISEETWIGSMNLVYDIQEHNGTTQTGRFTKIVAANLAKGRKYRFLIPSHIESDRAQFLADEYRSVLKDTYKCNPADIRRCEFRTCSEKQFSGVGFYKLKVDDETPGETLLLLEKIKSFTGLNAQWFGYVIPPSTQVHGDVLMDGLHLDIGLDLFRKRWDSASRIK